MVGGRSPQRAMANQENGAGDDWPRSMREVPRGPEPRRFFTEGSRAARGEGWRPAAARQDQPRGGSPAAVILPGVPASLSGKCHHQQAGPDRRGESKPADDTLAEG